MNLMPMPAFTSALMLVSCLAPLGALVSAVLLYLRHRNRIEPARRVPAPLYLLAIVVCGGVAGYAGVLLGIRWACSGAQAGNLCGLTGFFVVGPLFASAAILLVGVSLSLIRPAFPS